MNELKSTLEKAQSIIDLAKIKGWSEEELAKVINLLHSELIDENVYLSSTELGDAMYPSARNRLSTSKRSNSL